MKRKKRATDCPHRPAAENHLMTGSDTQWLIDRTLAVADGQEGYVNFCGQAESIKTEFQRVANSYARLGRKGRKDDVINLMASEIGVLRRVISASAAEQKEAG